LDEIHAYLFIHNIFLFIQTNELHGYILKSNSELRFPVQVKSYLGPLLLIFFNSLIML